MTSTLVRAALVASLAAVCGSSAQSALGGAASGIRADAARPGAHVASVANKGYTRHDLTRANGGLVREFENARGQVFAVTWSGPGKPDLRVLLGRHFATLQQGSPRLGAGAGRAGLRDPVLVSQPDLQIQTSGHMGWFDGVAFVPSLAPAGFATADLAVTQ